MYSITYSPQAEEDLRKLKRSEPKLFQKALVLLNELIDHPKTGTGHPEPLKGLPENRWSRQISKNIGWFIVFSKQKSMSMSLRPTAITKTSNRTLVAKKYSLLSDVK